MRNEELGMKNVGMQCDSIAYYQTKALQGNANLHSSLITHHSSLTPIGGV